MIDRTVIGANCRSNKTNMVTTDSEIMSQGEMDPLLQSNQQQQKNSNSNLNSNNPCLGRQSSIYSLTLDEFQHTLCDSGKNFGSMNMDEFLNSIWTAEENQAQAHNQAPNSNPASLPPTAAAANGLHFPLQESKMSNGKGIAKQPSLPRQGSLTIPEPLCNKTVDEVWSEIHQSNGSHSHLQNPSTAHKQATFGEMTLEDFLVRAGVVREQNFGNGPPQQQQQPPPPFGMFQNSMGPGFVARPVMAVGVAAGGVGNMNNYQQLQSGVGDTTGYGGGMKRGGGYSQAPPPGVNYGGRVGNGSGGFGQGLGMGSPVSPLSDGMGNGGDSGSQYGGDGLRGGRKRMVDGPVEKVVERRQRRMIKNRESAARSRARKQVKQESYSSILCYITSV